MSGPDANVSLEYDASSGSDNLMHLSYQIIFRISALTASNRRMDAGRVEDGGVPFYADAFVGAWVRGWVGVP